MERALLIDTNFSSAPIYNYLVQSGYEVFVVGGNPNDFLAKAARNYINVDYSNVNQARELAKKLNVDFIIPGCNDRSYQVCAELNIKGHYFGLDSPEQTEILNKKDKFRAFAEQIGLSVPRTLSSANSDIAWPVIVKPVDAYSGHGLTIVHVNERHKLPSAIDHAKAFSPSKAYLIEEYIEGQLCSHSAFFAGGKIVADFIVEEHGTANPFVVDTSRVLFDFPLDMVKRIRDSITLLASKLGLANGLVHAQFIKNGEAFWMVEVTRRCPGDLFSQLIKLATDFDYAETYTLPFVGKRIPFQKRKAKQSWVMRHTISQPREGILGSIQFNFPVQIEKMVPLSSAGDKIKASPFSRIALVFLRTDSEEELSHLFQKTLDRSLYTIHQSH